MVSFEHLFCIFIFFSGTFGSGLTALHDQRALRNALLEDYDRELRPGSETATTVHYQLALNRVVDFDVEKQVLTTNVWAMMGWKDERLVWDPETTGLHTLILDPDRVWLPDIVTYFSAGPVEPNFLTSLVVSYDGRVNYIPEYVLKTYCDVNGPIHVGDNVLCTVQVGSWLYDENNIDPQPWDTEAALHLDTSHFDDTNRDWSVESTSVERVVMTYDCCPEMKYPQLHFHINLVKKNRPVCP